MKRAAQWPTDLSSILFFISTALIHPLNHLVLGQSLYVLSRVRAHRQQTDHRRPIVTLCQHGVQVQNQTFSILLTQRLRDVVTRLVNTHKHTCYHDVTNIGLIQPSINWAEMSICVVFVKFALLLFMSCSVKQTDLSGGSVGTPAPDEQKLPEGVELFLVPIGQCGVLWHRMVKPRPPGALVLAHLDTRKHIS